MAAVATATENATELMGKLTLDTKIKVHDASPEVTEKSVPNHPGEWSLTPLLQEYMSSNNMCYLPNGYTPTTYYYGGYNGSVNNWDDYSRYMNPDGVEMPSPGVYGDVYHHGYGFAPYGAYPSPVSPVPAMGHDGQLYGQQHYQYPAAYYQQPAPPSSQYPPNRAPTSKAEVSTSVAADLPPISVDAAISKPNGITNANVIGNNVHRLSQRHPSLPSNGSYGRDVFSTGHLSSSYQDPRYNYDGVRSPIPWFDASMLADGQHRQANIGAISSTTTHNNKSTPARSQNLHPLQHTMDLHSARPTSGIAPAVPGIMSKMYPNNVMYTQYGNSFRNGMGIGPNFYESRVNGHWDVAVDSKYKPRGRGNGFYGCSNENLDGLSELNRGPRAGRIKNPKGIGSTVSIALKGQNLYTNGAIEDSSIVPDKDQFNRADFAEKYLDAKFFVIKSYSEDDVHKSIKYNVWASTPNGNKKLDTAYHESQGKSGGCPVFLFFSVNSSGQFVGAAEMVGPVDFNKTVEYWQQDKWTGCFPVKWHIVKDVPNNVLKHIALENNDNKPVTNSRDTQEVKLEQGLQILQLFKEHVGKTSILDDFGFYESRQKAILERRAKQQNLQRQIVEGKPIIFVDEKDSDGATGKLRLQKPFESITVLKKEAAQVGLTERKLSNENGVSAVAGDASKLACPVPEKHILLNGVAKGC